MAIAGSIVGPWVESGMLRMSVAVKEVWREPESDEPGAPVVEVPVTVEYTGEVSLAELAADPKVGSLDDLATNTTKRAYVRGLLRSKVRQEYDRVQELKRPLAATPPALDLGGKSITL